MLLMNEYSSEAIFAYRIEHEDNEPFFWIYFDAFTKLCDENKEFAEKVNNFTDEIFNTVPTYSVTFDKFGQVEDVKRNPPKLKLI